MNDSKKVCVIDDHLMIRKGLIQLINSFPGYEVINDFSNGTELIASMKNENLPDIVLLDVSMPIMDGYETARWIIENYPSIRILALSTMESETAIIRMIKNGARGYVLKDADPSELKNAFDQLLSLGYYYNDIISRKVLRGINLLADSSNPSGTFGKITGKELEFLKLVCSEKTYRQIASEMFLSERTIDGYRESLFSKLNVCSRVGLVLYAIKNDLVDIRLH